jgi:hypothetical protein
MTKPGTGGVRNRHLQAGQAICLPARLVRHLKVRPQ